jgi:hypothetical protein
MRLKQVSTNCFAVLNEKNRVCDANSGLVNRAGGVVIDTQSDHMNVERAYREFRSEPADAPLGYGSHLRCHLSGGEGEGIAVEF